MKSSDVVVMGGGLAGLSSAFALSKAGRRVMVFERDRVVGGLSKTVVRDGFRFDLGGHRFFSGSESIDAFVKDLLKEELLFVERSSKIYLRGRYFDYPLRPFNAMFGLGLRTTLDIMADYAFERAKRLLRGACAPTSLEDWVVANFGQAMFEIYFKVYSEKVWGIPCDRISAAWVDQRISGLSLPKAVKNALFRLKGRQIPTLVDRFIYPELGIGRISDRLREEVEGRRGEVATGSCIERVNHDKARIRDMLVNTGDRFRVVSGGDFVSTIPLTRLVSILNPAPPDDIIEAAGRLRYRDLVVVAVMVKRPRVTDLTWIYIPERHIPFGRVHEPTNWSARMAPEGSTTLVAEYFSFAGDPVWTMSDDSLSDLTIRNLSSLGFIKDHEVINSHVVRVPKAYPLFEVGHEHLCSRIIKYLGRFRNLHVSGRTGMFKYYNMDHTIESGFRAADDVLSNGGSQDDTDDATLVSVGNGACAVP